MVATESGLIVNVICSDPRDLPAMLKRTRELAEGLEGRIRVLIPEVVPYPLPIDHPGVSVEFLQRRLSEAVALYAPGAEMEILLCRDEAEALLSALLPCSVVVMKRSARWLPGKRKRLARMLESKSHQILSMK